jgi:hypothetical protein
MTRVAINSVAASLKGCVGVSFSLQDFLRNEPLLSNVAALVKRKPEVFDCSQTISLLQTVQPHVPKLFLFSEVDRIISSKAVRQHIKALKLEHPGGAIIEEVVFPSTAHVRHFFDQPEIYRRAVETFLLRCDRVSCSSSSIVI